MTTTPAYVVSRPYWLRGPNSGSVLKDARGAGCCLGHIASQCGFNEFELYDATGPASVIDRQTQNRHHNFNTPVSNGQFPPALDPVEINSAMWDAPLKHNPTLVQNMMAVNDTGLNQPITLRDLGMDPIVLHTEDDREAWLIMLGHIGGIRITFTNEDIPV